MLVKGATGVFVDLSRLLSMFTEENSTSKCNINVMKSMSNQMQMSKDSRQVRFFWGYLYFATCYKPLIRNGIKTDKHALDNKCISCIFNFGKFGCFITRYTRLHQQQLAFWMRVLIISAFQVQRSCFHIHDATYVRALKYIRICTIQMRTTSHHRIYTKIYEISMHTRGFREALYTGVQHTMRYNVFCDNNRIIQMVNFDFSLKMEPLYIND